VAGKFESCGGGHEQIIRPVSPSGRSRTSGANWKMRVVDLTCGSAGLQRADYRGRGRVKAPDSAESGDRVESGVKSVALSVMHRQSVIGPGPSSSR
jgi:hypothetical protein